jgi:hypothetical protein
MSSLDFNWSDALVLSRRITAERATLMPTWGQIDGAPLLDEQIICGGIRNRAQT